MSSAAATPPATGPVAIPLPGGVLHLDVARSLRPLDELCAFAVRRNARRSFLIVSRLLGRHLPARPSAMRAAMRDLAHLLPADLPEPMLVVGLAETAVCLGQGVHEELERLGRRALFVHSTRQQGDIRCSAGSTSRTATPQPTHLPPARVDLTATDRWPGRDEVSTGPRSPTLGGPGRRHAAWSGSPGLADRLVGLGRLARAPAAAGRERQPAHGSLRWQPGRRRGEARRRRRARSGPCRGRFRPARRVRAIRAPRAARVAKGEALRIVGTAIHLPPFLPPSGSSKGIRRRQAASRSPVQIGGPIASALSFRDNYGAGVANYLYNAAAGDGRRAIVCHETPPGSLDADLIQALDATALQFEGERPPCAR